MTRTATFVAVFALFVGACSDGDDPLAEDTTTTTAAPQSTTTAAPTATTTTMAATTTTVAPTTSPVEVVAEWMAAFPSFGIPGDYLEICGVVRGPQSMNVVVTDPSSGDSWPTTTVSNVSPLDDGQWCWEGEFPAQMENDAGDLYPIAPGVYEIGLEYQGEVILRATLEVSSAELVAAFPPSQSPEDGVRDGVVAEVAALPFYRRVNAQTQSEAAEGLWMLTRLSRAVEEESQETGCRFGDQAGTYPVDVICTVEYGEILLVDDEGNIARAYPMPGAIPSWIHVGDTHVYSGHIGDGSLPDSTLVKIDRTTLDATVVVIPAPFDGGTEWLPDWHLAPEEIRDSYDAAVHINTDEPGTTVSSWLGDFTVDLDAIDEIIAAVVG